MIAHISEPSLAMDGKQLQPREDIGESGFKKTPNLLIEKGTTTDAEFTKEAAGGAWVFQHILNPTAQ